MSDFDQRAMNLKTCRYFNGIQHETCEMGVNYQSVCQKNADALGERFPCFRMDGAAFCKHYTPKPLAEVEAEEAAVKAIVAEIVRKDNAFASGETHACPECGAEVTGATIYEKTEPEVFSLYVRPCGHRLGLWSKVPEWITDVVRVPLSEDEN